MKCRVRVVRRIHKLNLLWFVKFPRFARGARIGVRRVRVGIIHIEFASKMKWKSADFLLTECKFWKVEWFMNLMFRKWPIQVVYVCTYPLWSVSIKEMNKFVNVLYNGMYFKCNDKTKLSIVTIIISLTTKWIVKISDFWFLNLEWFDK